MPDDDDGPFSGDWSDLPDMDEVIEQLDRTRAKQRLQDLSRGDTVRFRRGDGEIVAGRVESVRGRIVGVMVDGEARYVDCSQPEHPLVGVKQFTPDWLESPGKDREEPPDPGNEDAVHGSVTPREDGVIRLGERWGVNTVHPIVEVDEEKLPSGIKAMTPSDSDRYRAEVMVYEGDLDAGRKRVMEHVDDGTTVLGRITLRQRDNRLHMWHLKVRREARGLGLGGYLMDVFEEYVRQADDVDRVSGVVANPRGVTEPFFEYRGIPRDEMDMVMLDLEEGRQNFEVVTFGAGDADPSRPEKVSLEEFDGLSAERFLEGAAEERDWPG